MATKVLQGPQCPGCFRNKDEDHKLFCKEGLMQEAAKNRPKDFAELSAQEQWDIDKKLGILDWDGF